MIHTLSARDVENIDFIPHAIFNLPVETFLRGRSELSHEHDALDNFTALYFYTRVGQSDMELPIAVKHYNGFPEGTSSLYLPMGLSDLQIVNETIEKFLVAFDLPRDVLTWSRASERGAQEPSPH